MENTPWDPADVETMLDPSGELRGDARLGDLDVRGFYKQLVAARCLDVKLAQQNLPMWASGAGEEAVAVCAGLLAATDEWIYPGPRDVAVSLGRGIELEEIARQMLGHHSSDHRGRVRPGAVSSTRHRISTVSDALGMQLPLAAGHAHAHKLDGPGLATTVLFGEGLTTTGSFYETIALASSCDLPLVLVCKSQVWTESAPAEAGLMGDTVSERVSACGVWSKRIDGADPLQVHRTLYQALERARAGTGPALVEILVSPLRQDPPAHRDPIERLRRYLDQKGQWTQTFQDVVEAEFMGAFDKALASPQEASA